MNRRILIVDDEEHVRSISRAYLEKAGYTVIEAENGEIGIQRFDENTIHLVILDIMMPKLNGVEVLEYIRKKSDVPIIMLTAKVDESDLVNAMKSGADDYVKKPFSMRELMVRVEVMLRRVYRHETEPLQLRNGAIQIDVQKMKVIKQGELVELTPNEFKILKVFLENQELVLSREQLIEKAFGMSFDGFDRTIDTHIKNLRSKLEENPKKPEMIKTVYGIGYQFFKGGNL